MSMTVCAYTEIYPGPFSFRNFYDECKGWEWIDGAILRWPELDHALLSRPRLELVLVRSTQRIRVGDMLTYVNARKGTPPGREGLALVYKNARGWLERHLREFDVVWGFDDPSRCPRYREDRHGQPPLETVPP